MLLPLLPGVVLHAQPRLLTQLGRARLAIALLALPRLCLALGLLQRALPLRLLPLRQAPKRLLLQLLCSPGGPLLAESLLLLFCSLLLQLTLPRLTDALPHALLGLALELPRFGIRLSLPGALLLEFPPLLLLPLLGLLASAHSYPLLGLPLQIGHALSLSMHLGTLALLLLAACIPPGRRRCRCSRSATGRGGGDSRGGSRGGRRYASRLNELLLQIVYLRELLLALILSENFLLHRPLHTRHD
mmetsp:Transcript_42400/g.95700  ORF Transcript_42400/g.95700 Transcript_42400/m.95700 type:complete len:245 (-) Transcript_42400:606-1340(-)